MATVPFTVDVPLRWSDMDAYGHVNNVQFARLMEEARIIGFRDWFGPDLDPLADGIVVARNEIDYLAPLTYEHRPVRVDLWVTRVGGAGFDIGYEFRDPGDERGTVYARAETSLVAFDFATSRPRRLGDAEKEVLGRLVGEPVRLRRRERPAIQGGTA